MFHMDRWVFHIRLLPQLKEIVPRLIGSFSFAHLVYLVHELERLEVKIVLANTLPSVTSGGLAFKLSYQND